MTPCPYCSAPMPMPKRRGHNVYVLCPACLKKSRAVFADICDGSALVHYVACARGAGLILRAYRIPAEIAAWLDERNNASDDVRLALSQYRDKMTAYNSAAQT